MWLAFFWEGERRFDLDGCRCCGPNRGFDEEWPRRDNSAEVVAGVLDSLGDKRRRL